MDDPNITMEEYIGLEEEKAHRHARCITRKLLRIVESGMTMKFTTSDMLKPNSQLQSLMTRIRERIYKPLFTYAPKSDFLTEPAINPQHIDEINSKDETYLPEYDEEEQNILYFIDLFPFNIIYLDDSKSNKDSDDKPWGDVSIIPSPNEINTDVGAYAHGSTMLSKTSHDTSGKNSKLIFFVELNINIVTLNYIHEGEPLTFIIKNLYVPFGIPLDPKRVYKDGVSTRKLRRPRIKPGRVFSPLEGARLMIRRPLFFVKISSSRRAVVLKEGLRAYEFEGLIFGEEV
ncbi:hypothetical protein Tco_0381951 [Tanacetum coccineum]